MLPLRDHNPTSRPAVLVPLIVAANAIVFFFWQPTFGSEQDQVIFTVCRAAIPYEAMHGDLVLDAVADGRLQAPDLEGAQRLQAVAVVEDRFCPDKSIWTSIVVSMFMHGSIPHILFNMLFLWVFGNNLEDRLGIVKFMAFYLTAGVAAVYAHSVLFPDSSVPLLGASGAIAGVLGAYLLLYPRARVTTLVIFFFVTVIEVPAAILLGLWFVLQLFQQLSPVAGDVGGVAYMAHIGGFVAGMLLLLLLRPQPRNRRIDHL